MAFKIAMFSDFVCPFCYIGFRTMRNLKRELDFELEWRGFEIHPERPPTGLPTERVYGPPDSELRKAVWARVSSLADAARLAMKSPEILANSHAALLAAEYACDAGAGHAEAFEEQVYRAYFERGANIGDLEVLKRAAAEAGLDPQAVAEATQSPKYELRLRNNALVARSRGVSGVPTFFIGDFPLVGAQSEDVMRMLIARAAQRSNAGG
jgi:predicted DsbA family dithiol-disulfide isomerase